MADILAYGEALIEFNQANQADGGSTSWTFGYGGDTSNFAIAAARQGARTAYISAVGGEHFGQALRALWQAEGVDHTYVHTDKQAPTGLYFVSHDARGHHFDYLRAGSAASRFQTAQLPLQAIAAAQEALGAGAIRWRALPVGDPDLLYPDLSPDRFGSHLLRAWAAARAWAHRRFFAVSV